MIILFFHPINRVDARHHRESEGVFILDPNWAVESVRLPFVPTTRIQHVKWDGSGFMLVTVEESGKIRVWMMENSVSRWKVIFEWALNEAAVLVKWLEGKREAVAEFDGGKPRAIRRSTPGPRHPSGEESFFVVTATGKAVIFYQKGQTFATASTFLAGGSGHFPVKITHADAVLQTCEPLPFHILHHYNSFVFYYLFLILFSYLFFLSPIHPPKSARYLGGSPQSQLDVNREYFCSFHAVP